MYKTSAPISWLCIQLPQWPVQQKNISLLIQFKNIELQIFLTEPGNGGPIL